MKIHSAKPAILAVTLLISVNISAAISEATFTPQGMEQYSPVSDSQVEVFVYRPDFKFKVIGIIEARGMAQESDSFLGSLLGVQPTEKQDISLALKALKSEAANAGATGLIILQSQQVRVSQNATERRIRAIAIVRIEPQEVQISTEKDVSSKASSKNVIDREALAQAIEEMKSNTQNLCNRPEYKIIYKKSPCSLTEFTLDQLSDTSNISRLEKPVFSKLSAESKSYRLKTIAAFRMYGGSGGETLAKTLENSQVRQEENDLNLYQEKISWGVYNLNRKKNKATLDNDLRANGLK